MEIQSIEGKPARGRHLRDLSVFEQNCVLRLLALNSSTGVISGK